jgi:hypothetical protein
MKKVLLGGVVSAAVAVAAIADTVRHHSGETSGPKPISGLPRGALRRLVRDTSAGPRRRQVLRRRVR